MNDDFLNQDLSYPLFQWFASKPDARRLVRKHCKEIEMKEFKNQIVVLDKGFVYHGDISFHDGWFTLSNCVNLRRYGTDKGLGQLALHGPTKETEQDPSGVIRGRETSVLFLIECDHADRWSK